MDSDLECQRQAAKKFLLEEGKREERNSPHRPEFVYLKKREDFLITRKKGVSLHGNFLILNITKNNLSICRVGLTVSRKIGNAVKRNFMKRVIRSCLRSLSIQINHKVDIEIIPKKTSKSFEYSSVKNDLTNVLLNYNNINR